MEFVIIVHIFSSIMCDNMHIFIKYIMWCTVVLAAAAPGGPPMYGQVRVFNLLEMVLIEHPLITYCIRDRQTS